VFDLLQKVKATIRNHDLLAKGDRVIVGFSGGIDSLCLLHILHQLEEYQLELWAVYINHSLRPSENIREVELLHKIGNRLGLKTKEVTLDIPGRLREKPQSLQLLAREERYKIFKDLLKELNATKVALGHHRDDQAETILYRVIRGTGIDGLGGIPIIRDYIFIRPLLEVSRAEIREYALRNTLSWLEDSSNRKPVYIRNKIRLQLIPELETSYNPNLSSALVRLGSLAREQQELMEALLKEKWERLTLIQEGQLGIKIGEFLRIPAYLQYYLLKRVLREIQPQQQFESVVLMKLRAKIIDENHQFKAAQLSKEVTAHKLEGAIFFKKRKRSAPTHLEPFRLNVPGVTVIPELNLEIKIGKDKRIPDWKEIGEHEVYLDCARPKLPFYLRFWRYGDKFHPLGAPGCQKLHDFFINRKVPREKRTGIPLLVTGDDQIVWVLGYRLNELYKITDRSVEAWHISFGPIRSD
jgi:tRNA(Ile)-lysidine synthase